MNDGAGPTLSEIAASPGAVLRRARESRGLDIEDVAQALKLSPRQIAAIEADAFDQLNGVTFARGFVRNYARLLDIDPSPLLLGIGANVDPQQVELAPVSNARGAMPAGGPSLKPLLPAVLIAAVVFGVGTLGWRMEWFRNPPAPASAEAPADNAGVAVSVPLQPGSASEPAGNAPAAGTPVNPPAAEGSGIAPVANAAAAQAPAPAATPAEEAAKPPAPGMQRIALDFEQDAWVEIRDASGKVVHSKLHSGGSSDFIDVGTRPPYSLVIGNAAEVKLRYKDKPVDLAPYIKISVARLTLQ